LNGTGNHNLKLNKADWEKQISQVLSFM
jgi:hypothetical protein